MQMSLRNVEIRKWYLARNTTAIETRFVVPSAHRSQLSNNTAQLHRRRVVSARSTALETLRQPYSAQRVHAQTAAIWAAMRRSPSIQVTACQLRAALGAACEMRAAAVPRRPSESSHCQRAFQRQSRHCSVRYRLSKHYGPQISLNDAPLNDPHCSATTLRRIIVKAYNKSSVVFALYLTLQSSYRVATGVVGKL